MFFTDAAGNTATEQPPLTAPIQYPLSQELVVTHWNPPSQWQTVQAETWVKRPRNGERVKVTEGSFTYVALDPAGGKRKVPPDGS